MKNTCNLERYLFRGISHQTGDWVYGTLYNYTEDTQFIIVLEDNPHYVHFPRPTLVRVINETIGQWTGIVDKYGEKIFEGDRLKISNFNGRFKYGEPDFDYRVFDVEWNNYTWAFNNDVIYCPLSTYDTHDGTEYDIVKLGSIHEKHLGNGG